MIIPTNQDYNGATTIEVKQDVVTTVTFGAPAIASNC